MKEAMRRFVPFILALGFGIGSLLAEPAHLRVVAANLSSGPHQSYSPDNGNHSNLEGAGARILKGLKPDVVLIQEFNTSIPTRQWVNDTLGQEYSFYQETGKAIPNGVISKYPIIESGDWDDPTQDTRDFAWAKIKLPNGKNLWAVSVHLYTKKSEIRQKEAQVLVEKIKSVAGPDDYIVLGGDFNTKSADEPCLKALAQILPMQKDRPADSQGNIDTNEPRNKPYDWVLTDSKLAALAKPVAVGTQTFPNGLVFDSRVFTPLSDVAPTQPDDSKVQNMQHMAIVRDFLVP
ncbi:hypothetical protein BH09VER1_BH09VER1_01790 [soil metagenome]